mmetsp:Transcript_27110/g.75767  ORF Transcript_27110/g.75767 Transcript_27110/m.75767 type:complete len:242 (-) Transcript_27110:1283-2008(-)
MGVPLAAARPPGQCALRRGRRPARELPLGRPEAAPKRLADGGNPPAARPPACSVRGGSRHGSCSRAVGRRAGGVRPLPHSPPRQGPRCGGGRGGVVCRAPQRRCRVMRGFPLCARGRDLWGPTHRSGWREHLLPRQPRTPAAVHHAPARRVLRPHGEHGPHGHGRAAPPAGGDPPSAGARQQGVPRAPLRAGAQAECGQSSAGDCGGESERVAHHARREDVLLGRCPRLCCWHRRGIRVGG